MAKILEKLKKLHNKDINVIIGNPLKYDDLLFFSTKEVLVYKPGTNIQRILLDTNIAKSWGQIKGTFWKNYTIPIGFTDLYLDGLSIWKGEGFGNHPHRLTILNLCKE